MFVSLASLAGVTGVCECAVPKGIEESRERGFSPVVGADAGAGESGILLNGCGFGPSSISFHEAKEGTGAVVIQDIAGILILL